MTQLLFLSSSLDVTVVSALSVKLPHWPSFSLPLFTQPRQVCTIMRAGAYMSEWASCFISSSPLLASCALHLSADGSAGAALVSIPHHFFSAFSPTLKGFISQAFQHYQAAHTPFLSHLWTSNICTGQSYSGLHPSLSFCSAGLASPISHFLHHHPLSEAPFREKQASCLFFLQKCLLAGQLVFHCPSGGWSCGWKQRRWPWGSCWRDWGLSPKA